MDDRERWDAKYRGQLGRRVSPPEPLVLRALDRLGAPPADARALDLASGAGRHALELAARGWRTAAWDVSPVALDLLRGRARDRGLSVATRAVDVLDVQSAEAALAEDRPFDLLTCVHFLDRALYGRLGAWLRPGGHLVLSTFTRDWSGARPSRRFRLESGELPALVPRGLVAELSHEEDGRAVLLARRPG